eukprot:CAMPEP_0178424636 /NCGR_PEP_ID=MMETSP0689_2-20121128/28311_1 /TAXON_ID=160604 /ORGANISM="Amphidinium massartii, Strain CS-259" /LENGTH=564 /DNA_ID=CAMNT_0020046277 /DNA_START=47 /DNA_END=1737 /DNA_ORIENTATION=-
MGQDIGKEGPSQRDSSMEYLEGAVGKIALSGRYHRLPHKIDQDYQVLDKVLGTGYNGVVKQAVARGAVSGSKYAIKAFTTVNLSREAKVQLETEVDVFLGMDHPHVARLFDVYESEHHLHLVMECMEGKELFDRVTERKRFSEYDAAEAVRQMLLSVNYLHSHGIVHRDLKLENFLYDKMGSDHLKLIDFGFSKVWDPTVKMQCSCGTLSYVAPEVLRKSYTNKCDLWSVGVIAFILLSGYMPFSGSESNQTMNILAGKYVLKPERWGTISKDGLAFVQALLAVDPEKRLSASDALTHSWIVKREEKQKVEIDRGTVDALRSYGSASRFRRACLEMMAWSLSNEERALVRKQFLAMDKNKEGTITLGELKQVMMDQFDISDEETRRIFEAMDSNHDSTIHYSDFLAAMLSTRIKLHGDLLLRTFKRFDTDSSGYITVENLREVLGESFEGQDVSKLIAEADMLKDGRISYKEFVAYLRKEPLESHLDASARVIDNEMKRDSDAGKTPQGAKARGGDAAGLNQVQLTLKEKMPWKGGGSPKEMSPVGAQDPKGAKGGKKEKSKEG